MATSYTGSADPYFKQRKLAQLGELFAMMGQARQKKLALKDQEQDELLAEAASLLGKVDPEGPELEQIRARLNPDGVEALERLKSAAPDFAIWQTEQDRKLTDEQLALQESQAMQAALQSIQSVAQRPDLMGASPQEVVRAGVEELDPATRMLIGNSPIQREFDPTKDLPTGGGARANYMHAQGMIPGMNPDLEKMIRMAAKLERTPEQLARSEERGRQAKIAEEQLGVSKRRVAVSESQESRLASGGGEEGESKTQFLKRRTKEIVDDNKREFTAYKEAGGDPPRLIRHAEARKMAAAEWEEQQQIVAYAKKWDLSLDEAELAYRRWKANRGARVGG